MITQNVREIHEMTFTRTPMKMISLSTRVKMILILILCLPILLCVRLIYSKIH